MNLKINPCQIMGSSAGKLSIIGFLFSLLFLFTMSCASHPKSKQQALPGFMIGEFEDDYGVQYKISKKIIQVLPNDRYHILNVNKDARFVILQNDSLNGYAPSLFSRIDYQELKDMQPFEWAICFTNYEEESIEEALKNLNTDKADLKKGCNGFPFSRLKKRTKPE